MSRRHGFHVNKKLLEAFAWKGESELAMCWNAFSSSFALPKLLLFATAIRSYALTNATASVSSSHVSIASEKSCLCLCLVWIAFVMPAS